MKEIKITIPLQPITKKNSSVLFTNPKTGKPMMIPSKQYREYEKKAKHFLKVYSGLKLDKPLNVKCIYYMQTRRKVDLVNLLEATDDILVKYEVLADDNSNIIASHDGSRVLHDKNNPRVEITITNAEDF